MMIKGNDRLKTFSTMSRAPNNKNSQNLLIAYSVPSTVLSIFQALLNLTATLYIIDQETKVQKVNETCSWLHGLFLKIILLARTEKTMSNSKKCIASSTRKAWKYSSFGHNLEDHGIIRTMALYLRDFSQLWFNSSLISRWLPTGPRVMWFILIQVGRVTHLTTIEKSLQHHLYQLKNILRGWDYPVWLELSMGTVKQSCYSMQEACDRKVY